MMMGSRVKWTTASGVSGSGELIFDPLGGHALVSVDAPAGEEHRVIYCALTWLTLI